MVRGLKPVEWSSASARVDVVRASELAGRDELGALAWASSLLTICATLIALRVIASGSGWSVPALLMWLGSMTVAVLPWVYARSARFVRVALGERGDELRILRGRGGERRVALDRCRVAVAPSTRMPGDAWIWIELDGGDALRVRARSYAGLARRVARAPRPVDA